MTEYLFLATAVLAGIHAFTYAVWLKNNGNKAGAWGVYFIILVGLALPAYRMFSGGH